MGNTGHTQDEHCGMTCNKLVIWQFILMETPVNDDSDNGVGGNILSLLYHNTSYRMNMTTYNQKMSLHGTQFCNYWNLQHLHTTLICSWAIIMYFQYWSKSLGVINFQDYCEADKIVRRWLVTKDRTARNTCATIW
jgi:hypothetical protein